MIKIIKKISETKVVVQYLVLNYFMCIYLTFDRLLKLLEKKEKKKKNLSHIETNKLLSNNNIHTLVCLLKAFQIPRGCA